jgi:hypothetical protein
MQLPPKEKLKEKLVLQVGFGAQVVGAGAEYPPVLHDGFGAV